MKHFTLPQQIIGSIELPSYELHTRPTADNDRKLNVFFGSRLIGYVYINFIQGQSNYVGTTLNHQSFGPYSRRIEAAEAVLEAFNTGLTDEQRMRVALAHEMAENMAVIAC
ncbi:hypothetical protein HRE53_31465 (plasmid) [Acaryochloris sp. 'Moss Beach']|uniref:hypothetical protein n=1 Tax=Acaryochloris sp. 'Moss Beach' TaxID=2740837 RepID=UPI001F423400|nr:hypothetical protein [Acaryochloris sp. 'Moss Beach']UJB73223.1 hypothetical protein HRE53_31465 [Acaryochloris sp. 'Moss Beach']